ncbi:MAG: FxsA family protein [Gammaproteobacteria bacterium]|nr:FxsA family protein [Gammaproteobacteria bacterium]
MKLFPSLLFLFLTVPIIEIYFLIQVGSVIGGLPTILLVVVTAVVGVALLRIEGFSTLQRINQRVAQGEMPAQEMLEAVLLMMAGLLLLTPGFLTDGIGFILLLRPARQWLVANLLQSFLQRSVFAAGDRHSQGPATHQPHAERQKEVPHDVIEGEFKRED